MPSHAIALIPDAVGTLAELNPTDLALAGFLASYRGNTLASYRYDLRHYLGWCMAVDINILEAQRPHLELYLRHLETYLSPRTRRPYRPATIRRMFDAVGRFYAYALDEDFVGKNPAAKVTRPDVPVDEQARTFLSPLEFAAVLNASRGRPMDHALVSILGMLGLRISEACSLDIDTHLRVQAGYDVLHLIGKGGKPAVVPLPIPVMRAVRVVVEGRDAGPVLLNRNGQRMTRANAAAALERVRKAAGVNHRITPHALRRTFITSGLVSGVPLRDMQLAARHADPRTTTRYDMLTANLDRHAAHRVASYLAGMAV